MTTTTRSHSRYTTASGDAAHVIQCHHDNDEASNQVDGLDAQPSGRIHMESAITHAAAAKARFMALPHHMM
jgi:hypothetical protein